MEGGWAEIDDDSGDEGFAIWGGDAFEERVADMTESAEARWGWAPCRSYRAADNAGSALPIWRTTDRLCLAAPRTRERSLGSLGARTRSSASALSPTRPNDSTTKGVKLGP